MRGEIICAKYKHEQWERMAVLIDLSFIGVEVGLAAGTVNAHKWLLSICKQHS